MPGPDTSATIPARNRRQEQIWPSQLFFHQCVTFGGGFSSNAGPVGALGTWGFIQQEMDNECFCSNGSGVVYPPSSAPQHNPNNSPFL